MVLLVDMDLDMVCFYCLDGVFLFNGFGDLVVVIYGIVLVKLLLEEFDLFLFGICLGYQIFGLVLGGEMFKLFYGYCGLNYFCGIIGWVEIISQNYGFVFFVDFLDLDVIDVIYFNLNDCIVVVIVYCQKLVFGVQYYLEVSLGFYDVDYYFVCFVMLMVDCY